MCIYFVQMVTMVKTCWNSGTYGQAVHNQIVAYLEALNTSAANFFLIIIKHN